MHRAVKVELFQQMPNYRKPSSFLVRETFPLPPYSSIIGMIHSVCGYESYHPMKISVQGTSAGNVSDDSIMYSFKPGTAPWDDKNGVKVYRGYCVVKSQDGKQTVLNRGVKCVEMLTDVNLMIHIIPENQNELEKIADSIKNPPEYISLGRREDIARVKSVDIVELDDTLDNDDDITNLCGDAYVPVQYLDDIFQSNEIVGTIYKIPKIFDTSESRRVWKEVVSVRHIPKGTGFENDIFENNEFVMYDRQSDTPVFFA